MLLPLAFYKVYKSCLLLLTALPSSKVLSMIVFDAEKKVLDTEIFPQHIIADLNSEITYTVLLNQEKYLW